MATSRRKDLFMCNQDTDLNKWLDEVKPTKNPLTQNQRWIWIRNQAKCRPNLPISDDRALVQAWDSLPYSTQARSFQSMLQLAKDYGVWSGKWLYFPGKTTVDRIWRDIALAVSRGQLGAVAKAENQAKGAYVICVYVDSFFDVKEVLRLHSELTKVVGKPPVCFKADAMTYLNIYGENPWGISEFCKFSTCDLIDPNTNKPITLQDSPTQKTIPQYFQKVPTPIPSVFTEQSGSLSQWLDVAKPSSNNFPAESFLTVMNTTLQNQCPSADMGSFTRMWNILPDNKENRNLHSLLQISKDCNACGGKWVTFVTPNQIDTLWAVLADAVIQKKLFFSAICSAKPRDKYFVVGVHVNNFFDLNEVMNKKNTLQELGLLATQFHPDVVFFVKQEFSNAHLNLSDCIEFTREGIFDPQTKKIVELV